MSADIALRLRKALDQGHVVPYFQPIVRLQTGRLTGFEVLARWIDPLTGIIPPDAFIPVAEEVGLIGKLTDSLMMQAFGAMRMLDTEANLSVNISAHQLRDASLAGTIERIATETGFPLQRLLIELTESAFIGNLEQAGNAVRALKRLGIRIALDDFGTGYSSLTQLQALPFDQIKIDRSFVKNMCTEPHSRKIVAAVLGLGESLGLITVAEGVEEKAQAEMLHWLGCEKVQGWLYGRPAPAAALPEMLAKEWRPASREYTSWDKRKGTLPEPLPGRRLAQFQAIYEGVPVGLAFVDTELRYVNMNQRLAEMIGGPISAHLGRTVPEVNVEIYGRMQRQFQLALLGQGTPEIEVTKQDPRVEGGRSTRLVSLQPARDEADEVVGVSIAVVDITARKRAEEALRHSQEHYRRMVETYPQVLWSMDADGGNFELSPRWEVLTGLTIDQTRDRQWLKLVHPEDLLRTSTQIDACLACGDPIDLEYRILCCTGEWRWVRSRGTPFFDDHGKLLHWYGTTEDVDEQKKTLLALAEAQALNGRHLLSASHPVTAWPEPRSIARVS